MVRRASCVGVGAFLGLLVLAAPASAKGPMELRISGGALLVEIRIPTDVFMPFRESNRTWTAGATAPAGRSEPVYLLTEYLIVPDRNEPLPVVTWTYYPARSGQKAVARFSGTNSPTNEWWTPHRDFERLINTKIAEALAAQGGVLSDQHRRPERAPKGFPLPILAAALAVVALAAGVAGRWLRSRLRMSPAGPRSALRTRL